MTLKTEKFVRKPFFIDGAQVTAENIQEVATWCDGEVRTEGPAKSAPAGETGEAKYIKVRVHRPLNERQTKAFVGDWVLYAGAGFKVYTVKAFTNSFDLVGDSCEDGCACEDSEKSKRTPALTPVQAKKATVKKAAAKKAVAKVEKDPGKDLLREIFTNNEEASALTRQGEAK